MIDYEKLKMAHELAVKWHEEALVSVQFWSNEFHRYDYRLELHGITEYLTGSIDVLIAHLEQINMPEPKYKMADIVWALKKRGQQGCISGFVDDSDGDKDKFYVLFDGYGAYWMKEEELYPSRRELIQAQIKYWQKLNCNDGRHDWVENSKTGLNICTICDKRELSMPIKTFSDYPGGIKFNLNERFTQPFEVEIKGFKCNHEPDGRTWGTATEIDYGKHKCIKCGEFYR